ncbi:MAG: NDP-sugar synthase [Myxococcaceae bacterium]
MSVPAAVLCAGLGTRLRPYTERWPKPAIPLLGRPLLAYALAQLKKSGVTRLGINTFHLPEVMEQTARALWPGDLFVSKEAGEIQGTGGGIRGLREVLEADVSVVLNGDVLFELDLEAVLAAHRKSGAAATMVLLPMPEGEKYNAVELDRALKVRRIAGVGPGGPALSGWHFTGVHVLTRRVFEFMKAGPHDINRDVYPKLIEAGFEVFGHIVPPPRPYWSDLGTPQRYLAAHQDLLFGQAGALSKLAFEGMAKAANHWAHPTARLGNVKITGPAWFGEGCLLEDGVTIGSAVSVGPGAKVGAGASLNRVAVLDGAVVPAGARLEDQIVA